MSDWSNESTQFANSSKARSGKLSNKLLKSIYRGKDNHSEKASSIANKGSNRPEGNPLEPNKLQALFTKIRHNVCQIWFLGCLVLGILIGGLALATVIALWSTSPATTATTSTSKTTTTATSATSTSSSTSSSTSTSSTSSTSSTTTTTSTSSTTTTSTSSTTTLCAPPTGISLLQIAKNSGWTFYSYNYVATVIQPVLSFTISNNAGPLTAYLDDVSVTDTSVPSLQLLDNPSFENSTTSPIGWVVWCTSSCSIDPGSVATSGCHSGSGSNCFQDRCKNGYEFIGQAFSATVGNTYNISFWLDYSGSGNGFFFATII